MEYLSVLSVIGAPMLAETQGAKDMYGLIVKLTAVGGKREELIKLLTGAAGDMPGASATWWPKTLRTKT